MHRPPSILRRAVRRLLRPPYPDPLRRRFEGGRLKGLSPDYVRQRDRVVAGLVEQVLAAGRLDDSMLLNPDLAHFDERVVEYPYAVAAALDASKSAKIQLLDAGCVLNNTCVAPIIASSAADTVWLMNASTEKIAYADRVVYIVADLRNPPLPASLQFPLVTCLSTLEHIGMDNTRYGGGPQEFDGELLRPDRFAIDGLRALSRHVAPRGRLIVSVPFGPFEYLYQYENPGKAIYYTFNREMLLALKNSLGGFDVTVAVFRVQPDAGWVRSSPEEEPSMLRHADRCVAAGAVAFLEAVRRAP